MYDNQIMQIGAFKEAEYSFENDETRTADIDFQLFL